MTRLPPFSSLLSPPEPTLMHNFDTSANVHSASWTEHSRSAMSTIKQSQAVQKVVQPISPPISPLVALQDRTESSQDSHEATVVPDPLLYPETAKNDLQSAVQLFPDASGDLLKYGIRDRIREHIARRDAPSKSRDPRHARRVLDKPTEEEYIHFVSGVAHIHSLYNRNPHAYAKALREQNARDYQLVKASQALRRRTTISEPVAGAAPAAIQAPKMSRITSRSKIQKSSAPKRAPTRRVDHNKSSKIRTSISNNKAPIKKKVEDINFGVLPDLSPPLSILNDHPLIRPYWPGNPADLSSDPDRGLLHESELAVASALRLRCCQYLASKRRIFLAMVEKYKEGKPFRRTDAQQACKIDVNKASKLWEAFDAVGWYEGGHFEQHLGKH